MKHKLNLIIAALLTANGNKEWMLPEPITVRINDFSAPLEIHGLQVSTKRELAVMTVDMIGTHPETFWNKIEVMDTNAAKIIDAIEQRVMKVFKTKEVVA